MFLRILSGTGTRAQKEIVTANSQMAIKCRFPSKSFGECRGMATESLESGKALKSFRKLIDLQP